MGRLYSFADCLIFARRYSIFASDAYSAILANAAFPKKSRTSQLSIVKTRSENALNPPRRPGCLLEDDLVQEICCACQTFFRGQQAVLVLD